MNQTVLITGTSSGYGKATAELFLDHGWNVVATMRQPKPDIFGSQSDHCNASRSFPSTFSRFFPACFPESGWPERRCVEGNDS